VVQGESTVIDGSGNDGFPSKTKFIDVLCRRRHRESITAALRSWKAATAVDDRVIHVGNNRSGCWGSPYRDKAMSRGDATTAVVVGAVNPMQSDLTDLPYLFLFF
jgi:hypothetical protein